MKNYILALIESFDLSYKAEYNFSTFFIKILGLIGLFFLCITGIISFIEWDISNLQIRIMLVGFAVTHLPLFMNKFKG